MRVLVSESQDPLVDGYKIYIGKGMFAKVSPCDYKHLCRHRWFAQKSKSGWYAVRRYTVGGKTYYNRMHREITSCPPHLEPHHRNGDTLDNRRCNLELVPHNKHPRPSVLR